jgi:hypothetical protein
LALKSVDSQDRNLAAGRDHLWRPYMAGARVDWVQSEQKTEKRNKQCTLPAQWAIIYFSHVRLRTFVGRANIIARGAERQGLRSRTGARSALVSMRCKALQGCEPRICQCGPPRSLPFSLRCCTGAVDSEVRRSRLCRPYSFRADLSRRLLEVVAQFLTPRWVAQLRQGLRFDLANAFARYAELLAHLF